MAETPGTYLLVLPVSGYRVSPNSFAIESAFALHLRQLREKLGPLGRDMVVAGPSMPEEEYQAQKAHLGVINESAEGIRFRGLYPNDVSKLGFLTEMPQVMRALYEEVRQSILVHSGNSTLYRPVSFPALLFARALGKKTISITDIDNRNSAFMNYKSGRWSLKEYLVTRILHDSWADLQQRIGVRLFSLVLLKGAKLAADYGNGRENVKNFLDSAFNDAHIISGPQLEAKLRALEDPALPVEVTYFGRLVAYKGIDHMLRAFRHALDLGATAIRFQIVGGGPDEARLKDLARELRLEDHVIFHGAVPFGDQLFAQLAKYHILLAAPLSEDTPRSALDATASGQAIVAYDSYYYKELAEVGMPVDVVPWLDHQALGAALARLSGDRARLASMIRRSVEVARENTQERWLDRRVKWTLDLFPEAGQRG